MNNRTVKKNDKKNKVTTDRKKRIALYVIYDKDGILDNYRKYYLQELRKVTDVIVSVVCGKLTPESREELEELSDEIFVRENKGLLAGAWIDGIAYLGWDRLEKYDELFMLNDSFFGPFYPLQDMIDAMEKSDADFYGAMKNYEEKTYTQIAGRPMKDKYFRGSICYFYIIKQRLLHSPEFKQYWSEMPDVSCDWDTYFFAEIDFYEYVRQAGFKIDAYQSDRLKGYFFDNLSHNMRKLIEDDKIPFARVRPFCTDVKDQSLQVHYGTDPRKALEYIDKHTDYDVNLIWDNILRTKNLSNIWNQLQLEYVVSRDSVEKPFKYSKKIAVILHIYYTDLAEKMAQYCENFINNTDFYITTTTEEASEAIHEAFEKRKLNFQCKIRPNVGVAMSTLWITYADIVTSGNYEYICYFHDKKSPYTQFSIHGEQFAVRCYDNLFGTKEVVKNIINLFEDNPRMGVLGAPLPYHGDYFSTSYRGWQGNYLNTVKLAETLNLHVDINPQIMPVAPYGDMFWFRSEALKKSIGHGFTYDDFDMPYSQDFTPLHAMERIYSFAAQDSGYYYADVLHSDNARSDLINYQYMLYQLVNIMLENGHYPYSFEAMKAVMRQYQGQPLKSTLELSKRQIIKMRLKRHISQKVWDKMRRIYTSCGGKKWIG